MNKTNIPVALKYLFIFYRYKLLLLFVVFLNKSWKRLSLSDYAIDHVSQYTVYFMHADVMSGNLWFMLDPEYVLFNPKISPDAND